MLNAGAKRVWWKMTPVEFFEFLEGNARDCHADPGSVRRAFNAAISASHLADHVHIYAANHGGKIAARFPRLPDYLEHLEKETNGAFADMRRIATVYKHLYRNQGGRVNPAMEVSSAGAIVSARLETIVGNLGDAVEQDYRPDDAEHSMGRRLQTSRRVDGGVLAQARRRRRVLARAHLRLGAIGAVPERSPEPGAQDEALLRATASG